MPYLINETFAGVIMNLEENWEKALRQTEIIRSRIKSLGTFEDTELPYIFLSKSLVNRGDTVVRKGNIMVEKPSIIPPHQIPQLFGFDFTELGLSEDTVINFFLLRGIHFPALKYNNESYALDLVEEGLMDVKNKYANELSRKEDIQTGLILGPDDTWLFSMLIFIATMIDHSAGNDIRKIIEKFRKK